MEAVWDILKFTLPALIVLGVTYFSITKFLEHDYKRKNLQIRSDNKKIIIPIRLQAYERIILYLERISLTSLLMRINTAGMSAKHLQIEMLKTVRSEFEHNLVQQLYVSPEAWDLVKQAKEETIRLINISSTKVTPDASGYDLSRTIINLAATAEKEPTTLPLKYIKKEIRFLF